MVPWTRFSSANFGYDGLSLQKHWHRLHAGDLEPLPTSPELLDAWVLFHNGQFEEAHSVGLRLGVHGATVAQKAACIYATHLEPHESHSLSLLQATAEQASAQARVEPRNANAHYLLAYSLGRYSQGISVAKALAQGYGGRIKHALETTIQLQPRHAEAHFALGAFHAEIIDKVGPLIGHMTFGVKKDVSLQLFRRGFGLHPHSPSGLLEYAAALRMLEGDERREDATALYGQAAALKPMDAREYLDIEQAKRGPPA